MSKTLVEEATSQRIYTCPMHPQIRQNKPGNCPICGMTLELVPSLSGSADDSDELPENLELKDFTRRFWISLPLSISLLVIANFGGKISGDVRSWIEFALCTPVIIWAGSHFFKRGWISITTKNPNMWTLISIGTGFAYIYSVIGTVAPSIFPASFKVKGFVPTYFEAASVIISLTLLGQMLELRARANTSSAIRSLIKLAPKFAHRLTQGGVDEEIPLSQVIVGDTLRIKPGEAIPTDGTIIEGFSTLDESMITGESMPIYKVIGDKVIGSTLNSDGTLLIRTDRVGNDTVLAQIVDMVARAQSTKAPMQRMADTVSRYFVMATLSISMVTLVVWGLFGPSPSWEYGLINAVTVLIIACPCALGLATPMSIMVASGRAATSGILFRSAEAIENLAKVRLLIVDKTGTLTEGHPSIKTIEAVSNQSSSEILQLAASLEIGSEHPLARAILKGAQAEQIQLLPMKNFHSYTGLGVSGDIDGHTVYLGNQVLLEQFKVPVDLGMDFVKNELLQGSTLMFLAIESALIGVIALSDPIKSTTQESIKVLQGSGLKVVMASGDNQAAAEVIGKSLGISEIRGNQRPESKLDLIKSYQSQGSFVGMVGDGVNDAPALTQSNVGIAMGNGSDIAVNSSDVTLVKGDLLGIIRARKISISTVHNMKENLFFAFIYNSLGIPIAAGALYPATGKLLSPDIAALAMSLSSASVVFNSLRLRKK